MTTKVSNLFTINGVIDTKQSVMANMQSIATACGSWVTYDVNQGKWAVVINQAGVSTKSFTDSNIIGSISVRGSGIYELYNKAEINFPNKDILDQKDVITVSVPVENRFQNEIDNTLNFSNELVNDPVQAELLASRELKQSRVDKIIEFRTDFTSIGLTAGDLIDVTNSALGFTSKVFRIVSITEEDGQDGSIVLGITALEYDADVYSTAGLERTASSVRNDIGSQCANTAVQGSNAEAALPGNLGSALGIVSLFNAATGVWRYFNGRSTQLQANYAIVTWTFGSPGLDLDIRARLISPFLNQNTVDDYLGWTGGGGTNPYYPTGSQAFWPPSGQPLIYWGGDNTGVGPEQVIIDLSTLQAYFPNNQYIILECRGNWYGTSTFREVNLTAQVFQGGNLQQTPPTFTVTGAQAVKNVTGLGITVNSEGQDPSILGDIIGYFVYDTRSAQSFIINDINELGITF